MISMTKRSATGSFFKAAFAVLAAVSITGAASAAPIGVAGGNVTKAHAKIGTDAVFPSLSFALIPGAARQITIPAGGDMIIATFSAECQLSGTTDPYANWVQIEIRDNNVPIAPTGDPVSPLAFCASEFREAVSVQVAKRLTAGQHNIQVFTKIRKGNSNTLAASIDDWSLTILQAN